jgi:hypothetical protein
MNLDETQSNLVLFIINKSKFFRKSFIPNINCYSNNFQYNYGYNHYCF